jgi:hypothetical protein
MRDLLSWDRIFERHFKGIMKIYQAESLAEVSMLPRGYLLRPN